MAKTHSTVDRGEKRGEILRVAKQLFIEDGFEATSIQGIASAVSVAPNTLYWYFADKDALLLAVLDELVSEAFVAFEKRKTTSLEAQLMWLLDVLLDAQHLITTVHARMMSVERVRVWHDAFHQLVEATIQAQLRSRGLSRGHEIDAARMTMFVMEGLLAHPTPRSEQRRMLKWLVSQVQGPSVLVTAKRKS